MISELLFAVHIALENGSVGHIKAQGWNLSSPSRNNGRFKIIRLWFFPD